MGKNFQTFPVTFVYLHSAVANVEVKKGGSEGLKKKRLKES